MGTVFHPPQPATRGTAGYRSFNAMVRCWVPAVITHGKIFRFHTVGSTLFTVSFPWPGSTWACHKLEGKWSSLFWRFTSLCANVPKRIGAGHPFRNKHPSDPSLCEEKTDCGHIPDTVSIFRKRRDLPTWIQCSFEVLTLDRDYIDISFINQLKTALKNQKQCAEYVEDAWEVSLCFELGKQFPPFLGIPAHQAQGQALVAFASVARDPILYSGGIFQYIQSKQNAPFPNNISM